ncbi:DUF6233 domain-containing protein [Streptomyces griseus]|uniref:DUF6233 domain-containing protein n=1 Tax=Streptomyces globisporus TaxID=1908 RepID=UPI001C726DAD
MPWSCGSRKSAGAGRRRLRWAGRSSWAPAGAGRPLYVHVGGHPAGDRQQPVSREAGARAVTEGAAACSYCRADTELGIID